MSQSILAYDSHIKVPKKIKLINSPSSILHPLHHLKFGEFFYNFHFWGRYFDNKHIVENKVFVKKKIPK